MNIVAVTGILGAFVLRMARNPTPDWIHVILVAWVSGYTTEYCLVLSDKRAKADL